MKYRKALDSDFDQLKKFCDKHQISVPTGNIITFIAEDNEGKIVGVTGLKQIFQVEPLISENPLVAHSLYRTIDGFIQGENIKSVRALVEKSNDKYMSTIRKEGFLVIETDKYILQKEY